MKDNRFELDMFDTAYNNAVKAKKSGNVKAAKAYFMQAAEIMERVAKNSDGALAATRAERAEKLKFIAENLTEEVCASEEAHSASKAASEATSPSFFAPAKPVNAVTFDDIIGLEQAKAAIHRVLIDPLKNPAAFKKYGIKAGGFILLEGPPGTGKTTFAKAAAHELGVPFAEVNANALVDSYIGKTGKNIDKLFDEARAASKKASTPVVMFLDELDFLAQKRGGENKTAAEAVPTLIKQMDGFSTDAEDLVLIAATNIKETLDPAVLSRFGNIINIPLPTEEERALMFKAKLGVLDKADFDGIDFSAAARASHGFSGRDITKVAEELKNSLAARDAGIRALSAPISRALLDVIAKRAQTK